MYDSALIYRTNLSALFSKEFLCASQTFLRLCIGFSSAVPGRVLVESELRQEVLFPSRVWLIAPPWNFLHRGGTDLCVFRYLVMLQSLSLSATCQFVTFLTFWLVISWVLNVERWTLNVEHPRKLPTRSRGSCSTIQLLPFTPFLNFFSDIWATEKNSPNF